MRSSFVSALALSASLLTPQAVCADWADEVPDPETVIADTKGENELDTLARQRAALLVFWQFLNDFSGPIAGKETPRQRVVSERYRAEMKQWGTAEPAKYRIACDTSWLRRTFPEFFCEQYRIRARTTNYGASPDFQLEILSRYVSPATVEKFFDYEQAASDRYTEGHGRPRVNVRPGGGSFGTEAPKDYGVFNASKEPFRTSGALASFSLGWLLPRIRSFRPLRHRP